MNYERDKGQITGISAQAPGGGEQPFVSQLTHTALGQPKAWNWGSGDSAARTYDADGRMTGNEFASYIHDAASRITGITQHLWASGTATGTVTTYTTPLSWTVEYDSRNRITAFVGSTASLGEVRYTYDANSNRLSSIDKTTSDVDLDTGTSQANVRGTSNQTLRVAADSNRLLGFGQQMSSITANRVGGTARTSVTYTVDAAGSLTSDGLRTFEYDAANRLSKARIFKSGEEASIRYLHNALGQRVFQGEPQATRTLPDQQTLGQGFIDWLKSRFGWMFQANATTSIGTAYVYGDGEIPGWAILGDYDNGSAQGAGRSEYIWLPTTDGAIPVGMYRNGKYYTIHTDHLGSPRLMKDEQNRPVWQWPYSAFGAVEPTGILKATPKTPMTGTTQSVALKKTPPEQDLTMRFPGQMRDVESGTNQNNQRSYEAKVRGGYTQPDPIGMDGSWSRFIYANQNPLMFTDPLGLQVAPTPFGPVPMPVPVVPMPGSGGGSGGYDPRTDTYTPGSALPLPGWLGDIIDWCMNSRGRGERGATGGSSGKGTDNPYKHCRNHPTDSNKIICKDHQTGKTVEKKKPADWPG